MKGELLERLMRMGDRAIKHSSHLPPKEALPHSYNLLTRRILRKHTTYKNLRASQKKELREIVSRHAMALGKHIFENRELLEAAIDEMASGRKAKARAFAEKPSAFAVHIEGGELEQFYRKNKPARRYLGLMKLLNEALNVHTAIAME